MGAALDYLRHVQMMLDQLGQTQKDAIARAGSLCAAALLTGHHIYLNPWGTHALATEVTQRAGGFMDPRILTHDADEVGWGDVVITGTNAGFDAGTVGMALRCRARGARTIAITTVAYERSISSADPSGKTLHEVADVVIDQGGVVGDALLRLPSIDVPIIPPSGVLCIAAAWMVFAETADRMVAAGKPPLVYQSIQMPGALERNASYEVENRKRYIGEPMP